MNEGIHLDLDTWIVVVIMNEGIHLDLDTWIVPGQIRKANLCRGLGNRYTPAGSCNNKQ